MIGSLVFVSLCAMLLALLSLAGTFGGGVSFLGIHSATTVL